MHRNLAPLEKAPKPITGITKPPNILILCENEAKSTEIKNVLKSILVSDHYAVYDIRWDQLGQEAEAGCWSNHAALLVLSGKIPKEEQVNGKGVSSILKFLGNGGRLLSWCCESFPFGPEVEVEVPEENQSSSTQKRIIQYGPYFNKVTTHPLIVSNKLWDAVAATAADNQTLPLQRFLETSLSRPVTVSVCGIVNDTNQPCILQVDSEEEEDGRSGKAILSHIHFEKCLDLEKEKYNEDALELLSFLLSQNLGIECCSNSTQIKKAPPEYTYGYLLGDEKKVADILKSNPSTIKQANLTIEFIQIKKGEEENGSLPSPSHLLLPIRVFESPPNFSTEEYFNNLSTKELGRLVIYTDLITSTMNVINGPNFLGHGLVVITARQTTGRGRGKNIWLSPEGCACFSLQLSIDLDSAMGRRVSLIQHIAGLAVVKSIPNHKELGLRVKWPNDIYFKDTKIGGILVESQFNGRKLIVNIGIGINVANAHPTISLNSILQGKLSICASTPTSTSVSHYPTIDDQPISYSIEKVIARVLSEFEVLLELIENNCLKEVIASYTENWIHGGRSVKNEDDANPDRNIVSVEVSGGSFVECRIIGIDEFGFLRVEETATDQVHSVRPDGNSFDVANNLIAIKN